MKNTFDKNTSMSKTYPTPIITSVNGVGGGGVGIGGIEDVINGKSDSNLGHDSNCNLVLDDDDNICCFIVSSTFLKYSCLVLTVCFIIIFCGLLLSNECNPSKVIVVNYMCYMYKNSILYLGLVIKI